MYRVHISGAAVDQNSLIPRVSSSFFVGLTRRRINLWYFIAALIRSIGLRSGD